MIQINGLSKKYGEIFALNNVTFRIPAGSVFGLLGPNGAGKTTFIRILMKIVHADSGEIVINGKLLSQKDVKRMGYLPEERGLYKKMKVGEQALYLASLKGLSQKEAKEELKKWFSLFKIEDWWNKQTDTLSKGMQQKIQFISAVVHNPKILILDEPFSGLDPINSEIIGNEILNLNKKGTTILFSSHNMNSVEKYCSNIALINKGSIILEGEIAEIKAKNKTNRYRLEFKSYPDLIDGYASKSDMKILSKSKTANNYAYEIQFDDENRALKMIQDYVIPCNICSFSEVIPSMEEIYISTVTNQILR